MQIPMGRLTLYNWRPFRTILQQGSPLSSIQGVAKGWYCPKAHNQRVKNIAVETIETRENI